jgi:hypothetical protein
MFLEKLSFQESFNCTLYFKLLIIDFKMFLAGRKIFCLMHSCIEEKQGGTFYHSFMEFLWKLNLT